MTLPTEIGKYVILGPLGAGHFGEVVLAHDRVLDVVRAVKILNTQQPQAFLRAFEEAQVLEKCRHRHIVDVRDADVETVNGQPSVCIVMEYLQNGSVQGRLEKGFLSVREACRLVSEALLGLEHAHNQGILHRDIKPGNILLSDTGRAKLSDFGLALDYRKQFFPIGVGYRTHLSPEALGQLAQDELSDIYAMGVTLYRLVCNLVELKNPYSTLNELLDATRRARFPSRTYPDHVPPQVVRIVNKAMRPSPQERFRNAQSFRQALERLEFAIDWQQESEHRWTGMDTHDTYTVEAVKRGMGWDVSYLKNNRRVRNRCYNVSSEDEALELLVGVVRDSTIR